MRIKLNKKLLLLFAPILIINILFINLIVLSKNKSYSQQIDKPQNIQQFAKNILKQCEQSNYRPGCYDKIIPLLMDQLTMEETFSVTKIVQANDKKYPYCHVLGHELSASEVRRDPENWKKVVSRCPSGTCSNGCLHGGFQERFRKESLSTQAEINQVIPDLKAVCEKREAWDPTPLEQGSCYHALGHLTMYITDATITKAIPICDEIAIKDDGRDLRQVCYDGAFMQLFQPLDPEDFALARGKQATKENINDFCGQHTPLAQASCINESWPLFLNEIKTPTGLEKHCTMVVDPSLQKRCYESLFYILTVQFEFDSNKIGQFCNNLPQTLQSSCYATSATRFIETDFINIPKAVALCKMTSNVTTQSACYNELIKNTTFSFHPNSEEAKATCDALPTPWKEKCSQKINYDL